jgi:hypothetical protein
MSRSTTPMPAIDPERYNQAVIQAACLESVMDTLGGKEPSEFMGSFLEVELATRFHQANEALTEVERRIREFSPKFVAWMKESNAPKEITEAYKWAIYGSAIHAQAFIVKPPNPEF